MSSVSLFGKQNTHALEQNIWTSENSIATQFGMKTRDVDLSITFRVLMHAYRLVRVSKTNIHFPYDLGLGAVYG